MSKNSSNSFCFFATPTFNSFAVDILKNFSNSKLHCIYQGSPAFFKDFFINSEVNISSKYNVVEEINKAFDSLDDVNIKTPTFDKIFGTGSLAKIIIADRKYGRGYIHGTSVRPDNIADKFSNINQLYIDKYFTLIALSIEEYLKKCRPRFILIAAVAGAFNYILTLVSKKLKIKVFHFIHTRISSRYIFDDSPIADLALLQKDFISGKVSVDIRSVNLAKDYLLNHDKKYLPDYVSNANKNKRFNFFKANRFNTKLSFLLLQIKIILRSILGIGYYSLVLDKVSYKIEQVRRQFWKINCSLRSITPVFMYSYCNDYKKKKFIYFPLHVDPESSTSILTPFLSNQLFIIELISKSLPSDMVLIVKEHIPMLGRRKLSFYKSLRSLPKVFIVNPFVKSKDMIESASIVCGISGTAVLEAILHKKPYLLLGNAPFKIIAQPHVWNGNIYDLKKYIVNSLNYKSYNDDYLIKYFSIIFSRSFDMPSKFLWDYKNINHKEKKKYISIVFNNLKKHLN